MWQTGVTLPIDKGGLWKPNSFYVWSQADVYRYGGTYNGVFWNKIPDPPPGPTFSAALSLQPVPYQLDDGTGKIAQGTVASYVYSIGSVINSSNTEYWVLPYGYVPAGSLPGGMTSITPAQSLGVGLSGFIAAMNKNYWRKGSALSVTGNTNYRGLHPPANP
jgi:hypothetical protein